MINFYPKAVKKINIHALLFSGEIVYDDEFNMVYGVLGGKIKDDRVFVEDACLLSHGEMFTVKLADKDYIKVASYSEELHNQGNFILGWYCSIPNDGVFFNSTNHANHLFFQSGNKLAIAVVVHPENLRDNPLQEYFSIYRLKEDLSENWIRLDYETIGDEESSLIDDIKSTYLKLSEIFNIESLEDKYLDDYLNKEYGVS